MHINEATPPLISHNISVAYRDRLALQNVSMRVEPGHFMAIIGPNGAGKSTLIKAAMSLMPSVTGTTTFFGKPLQEVRNRIGYMPQLAEVDWDFPTTVEDVVSMGTYGRLGWLRRPGSTQRQKVREVMEAVGITDLAHRQISQLSGGQKQRTFVARILAQDPDLFIMDEPFAGIDIASEQAIMDILKSLNRQGKTIVIVHHDLSSITQFATDVTILSDGKLITSGPVSECFTQETIACAYGISHALFNEGGSISND